MPDRSRATVPAGSLQARYAELWLATTNGDAAGLRLTANAMVLRCALEMLKSAGVTFDEVVEGARFVFSPIAAKPADEAVGNMVVATARIGVALDINVEAAGEAALANIRQALSKVASEVRHA